MPACAEEAEASSCWMRALACLWFHRPVLGFLCSKTEGSGFRGLGVRPVLGFFCCKVEGLGFKGFRLQGLMYRVQGLQGKVSSQGGKGSGFGISNFSGGWISRRMPGGLGFTGSHVPSHGFRKLPGRRQLRDPCDPIKGFRPV